METSHLREFVALAENLNFSETAKRLYVTQSTLSRHIANLEEELGCTLLQRGSHHVSLTPEGEAFYESAKIILGYTEAAFSKIADMRARNRAPLRIGYLYDAAHDLVPSLNTWITENAQEVSPEFVALEYGPLMRALLERSIDLAITMDLDENARETYDLFDLYRDCYCFAVSENDPDAQRPSISVDEIRKRSDLIFPNSVELPPSYAHFVRMLGDESGLSVLSYYRDLRTLLLQVGIGDGSSLVLSHHRLGEADNVALVPIEGMSVCVSVCAMWHRDAAPVYQRVFHAMERAFGMSSDGCSISPAVGRAMDL